MRKSAIFSGIRTPFVKIGGALKDVKAVELGGRVIEYVLKEAEIEKETFEKVIMIMVLQGGLGQIPSRQAAREAGIPWNVKTETINIVCASGLRSVTLADQLIRLGDEEVIVAGGMESMSNAPYFLPDARWGHRMGDKRVKDLMIHDGLTCSFTGQRSGKHGNSKAEEFEPSRQAQDECSYRRHQAAIKAIEDGKVAEEIVSVEVPQRKGDTIVVDTDEVPRKDTSVEKLASLKPAFDPDGTITAGNAPGVNDGAAAFVVMSDEKADELNKKPMATILG